MLAVIIPTCNDPYRLRLCLRGLARQTVSFDDFAVFVVSDGGDDQPADRAVLRDAFGWGLNVRYAWLGDKRGRFRAGAARNVYLRKISGVQFPRTLFLDGDCVPAPDVLSIHREYARSMTVVCGARRHIPEAAVAGMTIENLPEIHTLVTKEDARYHLTGPGYRSMRDQLAQGERTVTLPHHRLVWSFQLSVPTDLTQALGGFNEEFTSYGGEDQELGGRLQRAGCPLLGRFDSICYHLDHPQKSGDWKRQVAESVNRQDPTRNGGRRDAVADQGVADTG